MLKTALKWAGRTGTKHRNRDGAVGPVTRMTHDQAKSRNWHLSAAVYRALDAPSGYVRVQLTRR